MNTTQTQVRSTEEALKLALEALDSYGINDYSDYVIGKHETHIIDNAITAIKEALMSLQDGAQPAAVVEPHIAEQYKQEPDYAWPTIEDYENDVGFTVGDAFKIGWSMARTTNDLFTQMVKQS